MSQFTLAGRRVLSGQLLRPSVGVWSADLVVEGPEPLPAAKVVLSSEQGTTFAGFASKAEPDDGTLRVRLEGGGGGLARKAKAQSFRDVPLSTILGDTLRAVGETLSSASDAGIVGSRVSTYQRVERAAAATLREWAGIKGVVWRVLPDGTTWIGSSTRLAFKGEARVLKRDGTKRSLLIALEDITLGPEHSIDSLPIGCVIYTIRPDSLRAEALYL
jgi:hypothetical protein